MCILLCKRVLLVVNNYIGGGGGEELGRMKIYNSIHRFRMDACVYDDRQENVRRLKFLFGNFTKKREVSCRFKRGIT